jgi:hypothetical protein
VVSSGEYPALRSWSALCDEYGVRAWQRLAAASPPSQLSEDDWEELAGAAAMSVENLKRLMIPGSPSAEKET